jgi:hypothetical protein
MRHQLQLKDHRRAPVAKTRKLDGEPRREHLQRPRHPHPRRIVHDALLSLDESASIDRA